MESFAGHPIWDSLDNLATFAHSAAYLSKFLWKLDGDGAVGFTDAIEPGEDNGPMVTTKEGSTM